MTKTTSKGFEIARIRIRIFAFLINFLVFWLIGMSIGYFYGKPTESAGFHLEGLPALAMFACSFVIWPISEGLTGKSIGKWFFNIEILTDDSESISLGQSFARFFIGLLDYVFLVGLIIAYNDKQNKRLGDLVAKTVVVKCKKDE
ncbi:RDD family protein [Lacinutrix jangbogonensis]|uniref:RDD family protein n=1 Tax=Lacinutrix jangbogonensis TaxID=1469557 RepID=UPI00053DD9F4|nr:RDD family protein [Lacinutrix jangbogonensis]